MRQGPGCCSFHKLRIDWQYVKQSFHIKYTKWNSRGRMNAGYAPVILTRASEKHFSVRKDSGHARAHVQRATFRHGLHQNKT